MAYLKICQLSHKQTNEVSVRVHFTNFVQASVLLVLALRQHKSTSLPAFVDCAFAFVPEASRTC